MSQQDLLAWLSGLDPATLMASMAVLAAVENVFPPIPADVLVAFGGFLAARSHASAWPVFLVVWIANVAGAGVTFWLGRRMGNQWVQRRFHL